MFYFGVCRCIVRSSEHMLIKILICSRDSRPGKGRGSDKLSEDEEKPVPMSTSDVGRKGGSRVRDKYGEDYYRRIGKLGGTALRERRGSEYYREIAQKGGQANVNKYGVDHFSDLGKKGGNTTKARHDPDFYSRIGRLGGSARRKKKSADPAPE